MVTDHRQIVKRFYRLYAIKDIPATMDLFDPQVEMHPAENFIYATGKPYIGPEAIQNSIFTRVDADWDGFSMTDRRDSGSRGSRDRTRPVSRNVQSHGDRN